MDTVSAVQVAAQAADRLEDACGQTPTWICKRVLDVTNSVTAAETVNAFVGTWFKIILIVAIAAIVNRLVRRVIRRFVAGITDGTMRRGIEGIRHREVGVRAAQRAKTIGSVLRSISAAIIWGLAVLMILGEFDIDLGPLIAGAGIVGVALGFGAQSLVKDFLSGIFMLIEDQYGVGDVIDVGDATGTVESVSLRTTRLRDVNGTVWYVPNGEIKRVGNKSQEWSRALLDIAVAFGTDIQRAEQVIKQVADEVWEAEAWRDKILEEPEVWGVENMGADGVVIRLVVKTRPSEQFKVMRALRGRLDTAFREAGIELPTARTVLVQPDGAVGAPGHESVAEPAPEAVEPKS